MTASIQFRLNGVDVDIAAREGESLLDVLRDRCGVTSTKNGCAPQGQCGCCLAIVDGKAKTTCATPAEKARGKDILTLEGVCEEDRRLLAHAFTVAAGLQCGFCTPGIALRAKSLIDENPAPSREEIATAIDGNLCRCTGYVKILDAIELYAKAKRGECLEEPNSDGHVGSSLRRVDAAAMTLGTRPYVADLVRERMLHGVVVLSAHPHARVLSIDPSKALALAGVVRVATAKDVPGNRWYGILVQDWCGMIAEGEECRYVGDVVAVVAAEDELTARAAAKLVDVEYEVLTPILDPETSLAPGAPAVNPKHSNLLGHTAFKRGDVEGALASSPHLVHGTWRTQRIEHLFLEPESALAVPTPDGKLHLYSQGQGIFDDQRQIASYLGMKLDDVFVELVATGGAFGGKEDMSVQAHAALMAKLTGRPVRVTLDREESIRMHPKRHPVTMTYSVACDASGKLTAVKARIIGDSGAYASVGSKVLERAAGHACGPYDVPNVDIEAFAAYTNNPPCGAMRGFGVNQTSFAIEGCLDLLAHKAGLDGYEMRWKNAVDLGSKSTTGQIFKKSVGLKKTLLAVRDAYYAARAANKAVGIACGLKNSGLGNGAKELGRARIVVEPDRTLTIYNPFTEMGQGYLTVMIQCAVEVTGIEASRMRAKVDTTFALGAGQTTGSRATLLGGRAVKDAAEKLAKDLESVATLDALIGRVYEGEVCIDDTTAPGANVPDPKTHTAFGFATQLAILDASGRVERVIAAHDVGRAINPALCSGQIEGSIQMGLGYALTEELPCDDGMPVTFKLRDIGVLRARDMPAVEVILIEDPEAEGPFGAKGVGEIGLVPTAGAVAGALEVFDGVRRLTLPMKDSPASRAMSVGRIRGKGDRASWR
ncbi:MAG: selenium-dependent xanthine dehydrogenase [Deltaproteobacteria bacterium]|nr:selenium-dependent xanthine dehydrogenase [Deltaproteobacteria bacterium]